ncbi:hypothetical protein B0H10DRAFT_2232271 [Mycena sp. CBHHK59/15]|nr:hypothetical protein B0H10DRAFT_2232271 [Mycena sp. CBHHK59/15]
MEARTRQGTQFSLFEQFLAPSPSPFHIPSCEVFKIDASLKELLVAAQEAADNRLSIGTDQGDDPEDLSDWEDIQSRSPSPASSELSSCPSDSVLSSLVTPSSSVADSAPPHDMPALLPSPAQRRATREKLYQHTRRQKKRQAQAASPFTRQPHPRAKGAVVNTPLTVVFGGLDQVQRTSQGRRSHVHCLRRNG